MQVLPEVPRQPSDICPSVQESPGEYVHKDALSSGYIDAEGRRSLGLMAQFIIDHHIRIVLIAVDVIGKIDHIRGSPPEGRILTSRPTTWPFLQGTDGLPIDGKTPDARSVCAL